MSEPDPDDSMVASTGGHETPKNTAGSEPRPANSTAGGAERDTQPESSRWSLAPMSPVPSGESSTLQQVLLQLQAIATQQATTAAAVAALQGESATRADAPATTTSVKVV